MIQRLQSLFLFFTGASFWGLFGLPFASSDQASTAFLSDQTYNLQDHILILVLTIAGGIVAIGAIFLYKNRPLQLKVSYLALILSILLPLVVIFLFYTEASQHIINASIDGEAGIFMPLVGVICSIIAIRYIRKDEKVIKSMDRLR